MPKLHFTDQYKEDILEIYKASIAKFGLRIAETTMTQIMEAERKLANGTAVIKHDPEYHSPRFQFITIRNAQKIFFEQYGNNIYLITAGYDRRDWKTVLEGLEDYADSQVAKLSAQ